MIITKATIGLVSQLYDTDTGKFISQEFVAGDQVKWVDDCGEPVDVDFEEGKHPYLMFSMVQPKIDAEM